MNRRSYNLEGLPDPVTNDDTLSALALLPKKRKAPKPPPKPGIAEDEYVELGALAMAELLATPEDLAFMKIKSTLPTKSSITSYYTDLDLSQHQAQQTNDNNDQSGADMPTHEPEIMPPSALDAPPSTADHLKTSWAVRRPIHHLANSKELSRSLDSVAGFSDQLREAGAKSILSQPPTDLMFASPPRRDTNLRKIFSDPRLFQRPKPPVDNPVTIAPRAGNAPASERTLNQEPIRAAISTERIDVYYAIPPALNVHENSENPYVDLTIYNAQKKFRPANAGRNTVIQGGQNGDAINFRDPNPSQSHHQSSTPAASPAQQLSSVNTVLPAQNIARSMQYENMVLGSWAPPQQTASNRMNPNPSRPVPKRPVKADDEIIASREPGRLTVITAQPALKQQAQSQGSSGYTQVTDDKLKQLLELQQYEVDKRALLKAGITWKNDKKKSRKEEKFLQGITTRDMKQDQILKSLLNKAAHGKFLGLYAIVWCHWCELGSYQIK